MKYEINKPETELKVGYFTIFLKYLTLFIIGWIGSWILVFILSIYIRNRGIQITEILINNSWLVSIILALVITYYFGKRISEKYKLGLITLIEFDDVSLKLNLLNTINGKSRTKEIPANRLKIIMNTNQNSLFGNQRIVEIYEDGIFINKLNVDMTAWVRHPEIDTIITKLLKYK